MLRTESVVTVTLCSVFYPLWIDVLFYFNFLKLPWLILKAQGVYFSAEAVCCIGVSREC